MKRVAIIAAALAVAGCMGADLGDPSAGANGFAAGGVQTTRALIDPQMDRVGGKERKVAFTSGPLPFGQISKVCGVSQRALGEEVETQGGFKLYDTNPSLLAPRTHYVTGFRDKCARKFTASLVFLGDPAVHETQRYGSDAPFSTVDAAYEKLKSRVCRAKPGPACGERLPRMQRATVFVSLYRGFAESKSAGEILLHKGRVYASEF